MPVGAGCGIVGAKIKTGTAERPPDFRKGRKRMSRTPLALRRLPNYTAAQEAANTVTHIIGGAIGILVLICGVLLCAFRRDRWDLVGMCIYGSSMIALYTVSSVYHEIGRAHV